MKIELIDGLYYATKRHECGAICMGYSINRIEARNFCLEALAARNEK